MTHSEPRFIPVADHGVLVQLGDNISEALTQKVQQLDHAIAANPPIGLRETVPAFVNLLVEFDPLLTDHGHIETAIRRLLNSAKNPLNEGHLHEVLACYDSDLSPDLPQVAQATGLNVEAVINLHLSGAYRVGMYGFAPGYAYLSGVPEALQVPRKPTPLRDVPAGSVLIAGPQCLVSTLTMPTGWCIIGRSPTQILRNDPDRPFLFDVGDRIRFKRIDRAHYEAATKGNKG